MKSIIATALVALAMATTASVGANASSTGFDAAKFFEKIQLNGH